MTAEVLRLSFETEMAKLPAADRVQWMRFTSTMPNEVWDATVLWGWADYDRYIAIGWCNGGMVYVRTPAACGNDILRNLSVCEAARHVVSYLRERYAAAAQIVPT